jgi:hypothetical protein
MSTPQPQGYFTEQSFPESTWVALPYTDPQIEVMWFTTDDGKWIQYRTVPSTFDMSPPPPNTHSHE